MSLGRRQTRSAAITFGAVTTVATLLYVALQAVKPAYGLTGRESLLALLVYPVVTVAVGGLLWEVAVERNRIGPMRVRGAAAGATTAGVSLLVTIAVGIAVETGPGLSLAGVQQLSITVARYCLESLFLPWTLVVPLGLTVGYRLASQGYR
jgi:hypothetical protein